MSFACLGWALAWPAAAQEPERAPAQSPGENAAPDASGGLRWRNLGPAIGGGRVASVVGVPGQLLVYYIGAAGGGVWKTTDGGATWHAIFTHEPATSIGDIALAPSNPNLVWVGTGEPNIRNDVITGHGVFFSSDAGATWQFKGLGDVGQISRVLVSPEDANTVYVAALGHAWAPNADRGVFRTTDGGKTWDKVLYVNDTTGTIDLVMEPGNPRVLFAAMWQVRRYPWALDDGGTASGIYRSTDAGATWKKLTTGLPAGLVGRIGLAMAASDPQRIYALIESHDGTLWMSRDLGSHWTLVSKDRRMSGRPFYFSRMQVAPDDANKIFFLAEELSLTIDGGKTLEAIGRGLHPDQHSIWIDPRNPDRIIEGNDGGVYLSADGGAHWRYANDLPIEQFYQVAADSKLPYDVCGGLQDNSGWCGATHSLDGAQINHRDWITIVAGDGQYVVPAPSDPNIIYADSQDGSIQRLDLKTGISASIRPYLLGVGQMAEAELQFRFNWTTPLAVSATDPNEVYIGGNVLFKSTDGGVTWRPISPDLTRNDKSKQPINGGPINYDLSGAETYDTILSFRISPVDPRVIWVGTDDGLVQVTRDGGEHWTNVTANIPQLPAWGRIQQIETSPFDPATCYVAVDFHETDDLRPYVFKTHDFGRTWTSISAGLPQDAPARVVREDPNRKGFLVAGTDTSLWFSTDDGGSWQPLRGNLPTVTVYDLAFVKPAHDLVVATHGRGMFVLDNLRPLEEETPEVLASRFHLFTSPVAYRFHPWNPHGRDFNVNRFSAPNPPAGLIVDYYLQSAIPPTAEQRRRHETPVKITITDAQGRLVDTLYGPSAAGINRTTWNMSYSAPLPLFFAPPPPAIVGGGGGGGFVRALGPPAAPGEYHVSVTVNGTTQSETIELKADPRFPANQANFEAETKAALEVRDEVSVLNELLNRLTRMQDQLSLLEKSLTPPAGMPAAGYTPVLEQARALEVQIGQLRNNLYHGAGEPEDRQHYFSNRFHDELQQLMFEASANYDMAPRPVLQEQIAELGRELQGYVAQFNTLLKTSVAAFNRTALQHNAATVFAGDPIELPAASK
jgi:photosystem II stability/assembly factor-like uncharacterized protein